MKVKRLENEEELRLMTSMTESSSSQNILLLERIRNKEISYENCLIMIEGKRVLARIVACDKRFAYITLAKMSQKSADSFINEAIHVFDFKNYEANLHSDKTNFDLIYQSLLNNGFNVSQTKKSYIAKPENKHINLRFSNFGIDEKIPFLNMFEAVAYQNKDRDILCDINKFGIKEASNQLYYELKKCESFDEFWISAYDNDQIIGFIILLAIDATYAGVGYIGVLPEARGNGYGCELVRRGLLACYEKGIEILIAEADVENIWMCNILEKEGFELSCLEYIFKR